MGVRVGEKLADKMLYLLAANKKINVCVERKFVIVQQTKHVN